MHSAPLFFFKRIFNYLSALFLLLSLVSPARAEIIQSDAFGMHFHRMIVGGEWPSIEFGYLRLWDSGVLWRHLEPNKGEWKFNLLDKYVDEAQKRGVKVLVTLGQPAQWAAARPDAYSPYGDGASSDPRSMDDWRNYVATLAKRYKGRIQAWEVWNEANVKHFYAGDFARLAELEKITSETVKSIDPAAIVLTPSVQGGAFKQLDQYFSAGGGRYADAISYHFYAPTEEPEVLTERIRRVREVMARHGLEGKPLWNTEFGWLIPNRDGGFGSRPRPIWRTWRKTDRLEAAGFVLRGYLHSLNGGIRHIFWYAWDNGAMGLAEDKGNTPKPAAAGYVKSRIWLVGADFKGCRESDDVWRCELLRDGKQQWIVWAGQQRQFVIPSGWKVSQVDSLYENAVPIAAGQVSLSPVPVLLK